VPTPFRGYRAPVREEWIDYNGHLSDGYYAVVFSAANELLLEEVGVSADYRAATGRAMYTVEAHLRYLAEAARGDVLAAQSSLVEADVKRLRVHTVLRLEGGVPVATENTCTCMSIRLGVWSSRSPDNVQVRVDRLLRTHAETERPG
jgi:acyl-CoA thioesterase FadM